MKHIGVLKIKVGNETRTITTFDVPEDVVDEFDKVIDEVDQFDAEPNDGNMDFAGTVKVGILRIKANIQLELREVKS